MNELHFLLDSNIYGLIIAGKELHLLHSMLVNNKSSFRIYGFSVIRKELKKAPRVNVGGVNIQASLLRAYSSFIVREYDLDEKIGSLAEEYYLQYKKDGGGFTKEKLLNDFLIVACASLKAVHIVVSEDNSTMLNEIALKSYQKTNKEKDINRPVFIGYNEFRKRLGAGFSDPFINYPNKFWIFLCLLNILPLVHFWFHFSTKQNIIYKDFVKYAYSTSEYTSGQIAESFIWNKHGLNERPEAKSNMLQVVIASD